MDDNIKRGRGQESEGGGGDIKGGEDNNVNGWAGEDRTVKEGVG